MISGYNLFNSTKNCRAHVTNYVSVRWKIKPKRPFWKPIAKSKLFFIPEKKVDPPEQAAEVIRLHHIYQRQMRALRNFMGTNVISWGPQLDMEKGNNASDYKEARLLHEKWNAESARLREERLKREEKEVAEIIMRKLIHEEEIWEEQKVKMEEIVQRELEISNTYITEENLDKAIDECLANISDYNYAIDLSGNIYAGESMTPTGKMDPVDISSKIKKTV